MAKRICTDEVTFSRPRFLNGVELVSVCYRDRVFPLHTHDCYVVGALVGGAEALKVGGNTHTVRAGDVLHLHPEEPHSNHSLDGSPLEYRVFYVAASSIEACTGGPERLAFHGAVRRDRSLACRLVDIHKRLSASVQRLEQESALVSLVDALASVSRFETGGSVIEHSAVRRVREWMDEHFAEDFGLADLGAVAELSAFRVAHLFKGAVGMSPIAYRNQRRVTEARRRLLTGQPIADIANQLGFADQSHLTRQFQRLVGVSPGRYGQQ